MKIISNFPDYQLPNNKITTSKYTYFTFFPLNLIEQFTKLANVYFLIIAVMQSLKAISITDGKPIIIFPLFIVVTISMVKDFFEDYKRKKSDKQENRKECHYLQEFKFDKIEW